MSQIKRKCEICHVDLKFSVVGLLCGHAFCPECIKKDISTQLRSPQNLKCPKEDCHEFLDYEILKDILDEKMMKRYESKQKCRKCGEKSKVSSFPCGHSYCKHCLKKIIKEFNKDLDIKDIFCISEKCQKKLDGVLIETIVGAEWFSRFYTKCKGCRQSFLTKKMSVLSCKHWMCLECKNKCEEKNCCSRCDKILKRGKNSNENLEEKCKFCKKFKKKTQMIDLKCHKICKGCLRIYLEKNMKNQVEKITCPKYNCESIISEELIHIVLDGERLEKYHIEKKIFEIAEQKNEIKKKENKIEYEEAKEEEENKDFEIIYLNQKEKNLSEKKKRENEITQNLNINEKKIQMEIEDNHDTQQNMSPNNLNKKDFSKKISCLICDELNKASDNSNLIVFECEHIFCDKCLTLQINERMSKTFKFGKILKCPFGECNKILSLERIKAYINLNLYKKLEDLKTPIDLKRIHSKEEEKNNQSIKCENCRREISLINLLTLSCDHKCCKQCLVNEWEHAIFYKRFKDLVCPICQKDIDYQILQGNLSEVLFQTYDDYLLKKVINDVDEQNKNIECPKCKHLNKKSEYDKDYIYCFNCKFSFCLNEKCFGDWIYHRHKTCEEYSQCQNNIQSSFLSKI